MKCSDAKLELLEADRETLAGQGKSQLARHLLECPSCQSMAALVAEEESRLGAQMAQAVSSPDVDRLLEEVYGAEERMPGSSLTRQPRTQRLKRLGFSLLPLAAAAALVVLFLSGEPTLPGASYVPPQRAAGLDLAVPEGQNAAVLNTNDPDITVLWFF